MKRIVNSGRFLFPAVPVDKDKMLFNNPRISGRHRWAKLIEGWEQLAAFCLEEEHFDGPGLIQPVIVLRNPG